MSIDDLCALPVETLAGKDCLLFLWATFPQLPEALRLIKAWGFSFKTVAFVWLKLNRKSPGDDLELLVALLVEVRHTLGRGRLAVQVADRKSTRLNSSHGSESRMPSSA